MNGSAPVQMGTIGLGWGDAILNPQFGSSQKSVALVHLGLVLAKRSIMGHHKVDIQARTAAPHIFDKDSLAEFDCGYGALWIRHMAQFEEHGGVGPLPDRRWTGSDDSGAKVFA